MRTGVIRSSSWPPSECCATFARHSSETTWRSAETARARSPTTRAADSRMGATTQAQGPVRIPAFSAAISRIVPPRIAVCSRSMGRIAATCFAASALVVSSRPPSPTSTTCQSHPARSAASQPRTVRHSK